MAYISAYSKKTGKKQVIPEHWLNHPVLGENFRTTPLARVRRGEFVIKQETSAAEAVGTPVEQAGSSSVTNETPDNGDKE